VPVHAQDRDSLQMPRPFRIPTLIGLALLACGLGGCGTINEKLTAGMADYVPQWAGGLPADAPPRPGTAKYDEYQKERERKRLEPAPPKDATAQPPSPGLDPVH
jgi:hypothetical protein